MSQRTAVLVACLVGLGSSIAAAAIHYQLLADPTYRSVCDINATWNCTQVYESRYGAFRGVPVAVGGVIWFAAATLLAVLGWPSLARAGVDGSRRVAGYLFALSVPALSVVLYLAYASFFVLGTFCIFCLITYAAVIAVFLMAGAAADGTMSQLPKRLATDLRRLVTSPAALVALLAFLAGAVGLGARDQRRGAEQLRSVVRQPAESAAGDPR
jgi:uncharacterized membrane protein